jgi:hypothetical protein
MAYKRMTTSPELPTGDDLTSAMVGIGLNFAARPAENPNIEDTLIAASREAMDGDDLRVFSILITWLDVHHPWINADRLYRAVSQESSDRVRGFWAAVSQWLSGDRRFSRFTKLYTGPRIDLLRAGSDFHVRQGGEDPRFSHTSLRVPAGVPRNRPRDILSETELARRHATYRERLRSGPSYRADMWALIMREPALCASELARETYGSFATAWQVKRDHGLLTG